MTGIERRLEIDRLNKQIEKVLTPNIFTVNNIVVQLTKEIDKLQNECAKEGHHYVDGCCEYCYMLKSEDN